VSVTDYVLATESSEGQDTAWDWGPDSDDNSTTINQPCGGAGQDDCQNVTIYAHTVAATEGGAVTLSLHVACDYDCGSTFDLEYRLEDVSADSSDYDNPGDWTRVTVYTAHSEDLVYIAAATDGLLEGTESFRIYVRVPHDEMTTEWVEDVWEDEHIWHPPVYEDGDLISGYWEYPQLVQEGYWEYAQWIPDYYDEELEEWIPGHYDPPEDIWHPDVYEPEVPICHDCVFEQVLVAEGYWEGGYRQETHYVSDAEFELEADILDGPSLVQTVSYAYDANNLRIRKTVDADGVGSGAAVDTFFLVAGQSDRVAVQRREPDSSLPLRAGCRSAFG